MLSRPIRNIKAGFKSFYQKSHPKSDGNSMTRQSTQSPAPVGSFSPPQINSLEDTGLSPLWLQDLVLKVLYFRGYLTGLQDCRRDRLAFFRRGRSIVDHVKAGKIH